MADLLETIIVLKDEFTDKAKKVSASMKTVEKASDDMADSVNEAESRMSLLHRTWSKFSGKKKLEIEPVNLKAVNSSVADLEGRLSALTGRPVSISATAKVDKKQIKAAQSEAKALKEQLEAMTGRKYDIDLDIDGESLSGKLKSSIGSVVGMAKSVLPAAAIGAATAGVSSMVSMGSQRQQYRNNMEFFLGNESDASAMMDWASENAAKTQFSSGEIMGATSRAIQVSGGDMDAAKRYVQLAEDMTSLTPGKSISDAMEALADASRGEMERMKEFGFTGSQEDWENAGMDMFAMKDKVSGKTMDELFSGGTAAGLESAAAKWGTVTGNFEDAIGTIGEKMLNGLSPALDWMIKASEGAGEGLSNVLDTLGGVFMSLWNAVQPLAPVFSGLWSIVSGVVSTAFTAVSGIITNFVAPALEGLSSFVSAILTPALEWLKEQGDALGEGFEWVKDRAQDVASWFGKVGGAVSDAVSSVKNFGSRVIDAAVSGLSGFGSALINAVTGFFGGEKNAQGTLSFGGGFTQMNENARGEIVALPNGSRIYPYSTTERIIKNMVGSSVFGKGGNSYAFNVNIDARGSNLSKNDVRKLKREIINDIVEAFDNTVPA